MNYTGPKEKPQTERTTLQNACSMQKVWHTTDEYTTLCPLSCITFGTSLTEPSLEYTISQTCQIMKLQLLPANYKTK